jgi:hypothetical protein
MFQLPPLSHRATTLHVPPFELTGVAATIGAAHTARMMKASGAAVRAMNLHARSKPDSGMPVPSPTAA